VKGLTAQSALQLSVFSPASQTSFPQQLAMGVLMHPPSKEHESSVQGLPSSQLMGVLEHCPPEQVSFVQALLSLQLMGSVLQMPSQTLVVQGSLSSQSLLTEQTGIVFLYPAMVALTELIRPALSCNALPMGLLL